jgi:hypothetical protein
MCVRAAAGLAFDNNNVTACPPMVPTSRVVPPVVKTPQKTGWPLSQARLLGREPAMKYTPSTLCTPLVE